MKSLHFHFVVRETFKYFYVFFNFAQDIVNMEDEKEQLHKRIDRMQKKVHSLNLW